METLVAVAVAFGLLKAHAPPAAETPKAVVACSPAWHPAAEGCVRDKPPARSKAQPRLDY